MAIWLVRAGKRGEEEQVALDQNLVTIAWNDLPDLSDVDSREALAELYKQIYPDASPRTTGINVGQVWRFRTQIEEGDLVVLPLHYSTGVYNNRAVWPIH